MNSIKGKILISLYYITGVISCIVLYVSFEAVSSETLLGILVPFDKTKMIIISLRIIAFINFCYIWIVPSFSNPICIIFKKIPKAIIFSAKTISAMSLIITQLLMMPS